MNCADCGGPIEGYGKIPPITVKNEKGEWIAVCTGCGLDRACSSGGG